MTSEIRKLKNLRKEGKDVTEALKVAQQNRYRLFAQKGLLRVKHEESKNKFLTRKPK
jgi:hypothetical protein